MSVAKPDTAFLRSVVKGAREEARRQGAVLVVSNAGSGTTPLAQVDRLVDQDVDAVVIDAEGSGSRAAESVREVDVPVIAVGAVVPGLRATTSVVGENVVAGRIAAEYLFFRMGGTGTAAEIVASPPGPATQAVRRGFREIAERTPTVTVGARQTSPASTAAAASLASRLFKSNPELEGVFAGTDEIALGVVQAARRLGILGRVVVVGVGGTAPALSAVRAKRLEGAVRLNAEELGRLAVDAAVRAARGNPAPRRRVVDVTLVTEQNVQKFLS